MRRPPLSSQTSSPPHQRICRGVLQARHQEASSRQFVVHCSGVLSHECLAFVKATCQHRIGVVGSRSNDGRMPGRERLSQGRGCGLESSGAGVPIKSQVRFGCSITRVYESRLAGPLPRRQADLSTRKGVHYLRDHWCRKTRSTQPNESGRSAGSGKCRTPGQDVGESHSSESRLSSSD